MQAEITTQAESPPATEERARLFRKANAYDDIRVILSRAPLKGLCLDLPAGRGVNFAGIRAAGFTPIGADLFPKKTKGHGAPALKIDMEKTLPFKSESLSAILCSEGIEHNSRQTDFLRECARVLKPGGTLVITTPNIVSLRARLAYLFSGQFSFRRKPLSEATQLWQGKYLGHVHLVDYFKLRFMLLQTGFQLSEVTTAKYSLSSLLVAPVLYLPVRIATTRIFRRSHPESRQTCDDILRHALSGDLLFGKKLIVAAVKLRPA